MDAREIIDAIADGNLDTMRDKVNTALNEKAVEALQVRKAEIGATYFQPKE